MRGVHPVAGLHALAQVLFKLEFLKCRSGMHQPGASGSDREIGGFEAGGRLPLQAPRSPYGVERPWRRTQAWQAARAKGRRLSPTRGDSRLLPSRRGLVRAATPCQHAQNQEDSRKRRHRPRSH
jgi:hypothetical protein